MKRKALRGISLILAFLLAAGCFATAFADETEQLPPPEESGAAPGTPPEETGEPEPAESPEVPAENPGETPSDPQPTPTPPPTPEPQRELTEEEKQRELELSWPASAIWYNWEYAVSESRDKMVGLAADAAAKSAGKGGRFDGSLYSRWFEGTHPGMKWERDTDGWSAVFLMWLAEHSGLNKAANFPFAVSAAGLESALTAEGQQMLGAEDFSTRAKKRLTFKVGDLVFLPADGSETGRRVGIVTAVDRKGATVVAGDLDGAVGTVLLAQADILSGKLPAGTAVARYAYPTNAEIIFDFLTKEMGFNRAAACGILANALAESMFNPKAVEMGGDSFGVFQWRLGRLEKMYAYCAENGLDPELLDSQLEYFRHEVETDFPRTSATWYSLPDSAWGAQQVANDFCINYEAPVNRWWNGRRRGLTAAQVVWRQFKDRPVE